MVNKVVESQSSSFFNTLICRPASFFTLAVLQQRDEQSRRTTIAAVPQLGRLAAGNHIEYQTKQLMSEMSMNKHKYTKRTTPTLFSKKYFLGQTIGIGGEISSISTFLATT